MSITYGSQQADVTDGNGAERKWTVMVFMSADRMPEDVDLSAAAVDDIREMATIGSGRALNVFVQVHGVAAEPRRAHVTKNRTWERIAADSSTIVPEPERDTKNGIALEAFIRDSLQQAKHDPTNPHHYSMLVLWGHAYDFGIARVRTTSGTPDALDFSELGNVLERMQSRFQSYFNVKERPRLDVVAFDACDVAMVELAFELAPYVNYLLGSEVGVPIPGWPYDRILKQLRLPFGRVMSPPEFGVWAVRRYIEAYSPVRSVSLSMLNLNKVVPVVARVKVLCDAILEFLDAEPGADEMIADLLARSLTMVERPYIDVADFCVNLSRESGNETITAASRALGDTLVASQFPIVGKSEDFAAYPFVVAHGRNAGDTAKLNGVSLYAPHRTADEQSRNVRTLYESMKFARVTRWSEFVHAMAPLV